MSISFEIANVRRDLRNRCAHTDPEQKFPAPSNRSSESSQVIRLCVYGLLYELTYECVVVIYIYNILYDYYVYD